VTPSKLALHTLGRLLSDQPVNGEVDRVDGSFAPIVRHLAGLPFDARGPAWDAFCLAPGIDRESITRELAAIDIFGPEPTAEAPKSFATIADLRRAMAKRGPKQ